MKFISYTLAAALSTITTSPVVADKPECKTIVEIAKGVDELSTLVAALTAADLVDTLSGDGPFTVFAPTDETGFGALPEGTIADLLMPENKAKLTGLLLGHVVGGKVKSDDLVDGPVTTLNGDVVTVDVTDKGIKIDDAYVKKADIEACNGVIHIIDKVLLPVMPKEPETSSPTDTLSSKSGKSTAKASKAGSNSAKAGKSDTDKMKTAPSAKAGKSDTDQMKTSSAKAEKASAPTSGSAKAAKGADETDVPEEPEEPEEPKAEDESDKAEEEEEKEEEEEETLSVFQAFCEIFKILIDGPRKLSSHLRG